MIDINSKLSSCTFVVICNIYNKMISTRGSCQLSLFGQDLQMVEQPLLK